MNTPSPSIMWDLADLANIGDLALEFNVGRAAVCNWRERYASFPAPVVTLGNGVFPVFSRTQVRAWYGTRIWGKGRYRQQGGLRQVPNHD